MKKIENTCSEQVLNALKTLENLEGSTLSEKIEIGYELRDRIDEAETKLESLCENCGEFEKDEDDNELCTECLREARQDVEDEAGHYRDWAASRGCK